MKVDPRSDEVIFLGYFSHSKAYKVFNKRILCVEESVHVLFDETNSLVENNAQYQDFNLGHARKDNGKMLESEPLPEDNAKESGQEVD